MPLDVKTSAEQWFNKMGIHKADGVIGLDNTNFQIMPIPLVEEMISLSRAQSQWLKSISSWTRKRATGVVPLINIAGNVTEGVGPNDPTPVAKRPDTAKVEYSCKKFKSEYYIDYETLEEYAATPELGDFEARMAQEFAVKWGNDRADIIMNSDNTLDASTSRNRMLRMIDGVQKQLAGANIYNAQGKKWGQGVWAVMQAYMPEEYRNDPNLHYIYNDLIDLLWHNSLTNVNTGERMRSALGDSVIASETKVKPLGKPQLIIPQLSANQGVTPVAPTSVVDDGDGTMTIRVNTILADATDSTGRRVKVIFKQTGKEEVCTVSRNGSNQNIIGTVGSLGQDTISTTASDYTVSQNDETNIVYGNPKGIYEIICNQVRSYREYNKDADRFEITMYFRMDVLLPIPGVFVDFERIVAPVPTDWIAN